MKPVVLVVLDHQQTGGSHHQHGGVLFEKVEVSHHGQGPDGEGPHLIPKCCITRKLWAHLARGQRALRHHPGISECHEGS